MNEIQLSTKPIIYNSAYYAFITGLDLTLMCLFFRDVDIDIDAVDSMHKLLMHMAGSSLFFAINMIAVMIVHYFSKLSIP